MRPALLTTLLLAVLTGCAGGGDSEREDVKLDGRSAGGARVTLVAALGDSITAGSPLWDPDPVVRDTIGAEADPESQYEYWAQLRLKRTRFRNCGVFGERTDEIAARLDRCARGADVLVIQGGINDVAQMRGAGSAAKNLQAMVRRARKLGPRVALAEVLPWNNGAPGMARGIRELNRLIAEIGREQDVPVFPWYRRLEDPRAPGRMRPAFTVDGDHPSVAGYRRLAGVVELP